MTRLFDSVHTEPNDGGGGGRRPASTSVEVVRLATDPRLILELKAVAIVGV